MKSKAKTSFVIALLILATVAAAVVYSLSQRSSTVEQTVAPPTPTREEQSTATPTETEERREVPTTKQAGINLDCARRYCSPKELKRYIDLAAEYENGFVQIHLTDNQSVGVESVLLDQRATDKNRNADGSYTNLKTNKKFLSRKQLADLQSYAKRKQVELVPEIDLPAHAGGFLQLAALKYGRQSALEIAADFEEGELDISRASGRKFAEDIYAEYADLFAGNRYFHIGCDELFSASEKDKLAFIQRTTSFFEAKGFTVRLWNDFITKKNLSAIPKSVEVTYWSHDGDTEDDDERDERRRIRASLPDLQSRGISVLNYNSYYLYFIPSTENVNSKLATNKGILGAAISVWREDSDGVSDDELYQHASRFYRAMADKVTSEK